MRLYDEIFKNADGAASARYTVVCGGGGYFEGVKTVGDFCDNRIVLYFPRACIEVEGIDLSIGKYCDGDLELRGKILSTKLLEGENQDLKGGEK